jgi:hypothetical protein
MASLAGVESLESLKVLTAGAFMPTCLYRNYLKLRWLEAKRSWPPTARWWP